MKIALAQLNPLIGDLQGNARKIIDTCKQAIKQGADVILTPELSLWGYPPRDLLLDPTRCNQQTGVLNQIADELNREASNSILLVGVAEQAPDLQLPKLFNSIVLVTNGSWKVVARKQLLPTYDVFDEKRYFRPAQATSIIHLKAKSQTLKVGITICEDLWVDEKVQSQRVKGPDPVSKLEKSNIEVLVNFDASPFG